MFHVSVASGDSDVLEHVRTRTRWSSNLVRNDKLTNFLQVTVREHEANTAPNVRKMFELRKLGEYGTKCIADHGVLAHEDDALSAEGLCSLTQLAHEFESEL